MSDHPNGPGKPCQRTPCVEANRAAQRKVLDLMIRDGFDTDKQAAQSVHIDGLAVGDHLGGAHLNPYDRDHYDGIGVLYNAQPVDVKRGTYDLLCRVGAFTRPTADTDEATPLRPVVEQALDACLTEIDRLRQQVAAVRVDADRKVRDAMTRSADCEHHGQEIVELGKQLTAAGRRHDKAERARLVLLGFLATVDDWLAARKAMIAESGERPEEQARVIADALTKWATKTHAAHKQAWKDQS